MRICFVYKGKLPVEEDLLPIMQQPCRFISEMSVAELKENIKEAELNLDYERSKLISPLIIKLDHEQAELEEPPPEGLDSLGVWLHKEKMVPFWQALCTLIQVKLESKVLGPARTRVRKEYRLEVKAILASKDYDELKALEKEMRARMAVLPGCEGYWDYLLSKARKRSSVLVL